MIYVFLVLLAAVVVWRIILPGMRLEPRTGVVDTSAKSSAFGLNFGEWVANKQYVWSILLIVVGVAVIFWEINNPQIRPMDVGNVSWKYWHVVLTIWGIGAALIALNACGAVAKTLQWVLAGAVATVLVVFPLCGWTTSPSAATAQKQVRPAETAVPMTLTLPAGVDEKSKRIPVPFRKRVVMTGEDFRFHCVYGDGSEESFLPEKEPPCRDGDLPFVYATNLKNEENVVAYAYAGPPQ